MFFRSQRESSGENSYSSTKSFEEWTETNQSLFPFLERLQIKTKLSFPQFQNKRRGIHNRCVDDLIVYKSKLERKMEKLQNLITGTQSLHYSPIGAVVYDSKEQNMDIRKFCFVKREIQQKEVLLYSKQYLAFEQLLQKCQSFLDLYSNDIVPQNEIHRIKNSFFTLKQFSFPKEEKEIIALKSYLHQLKAKLLTYEVPLWKTHFSRFLYQISKKGLSQSDPDISYFRPIEEEVSLSRALFSTNSPYSEQFDTYINNNFQKITNDAFVQGLVDICMKLIPKSLKTDAHKSALALQLFRTAFNRVYELYPSAFTSTNVQIVNKIDQLKSSDFSTITVSHELLGEEPSGAISSFFAKDPIYWRAGDALCLSIFQPNPFDSLYYIHLSLNYIQRAALIHRSEHELIKRMNNPKPEDAYSQTKRYMLCFDDLFTLFYGSMLAADYQDIVFVSHFVNDFVPKANLAPGFEYALANIEALAIHFQKLLTNYFLTICFIILF